MSLYDEGGDPSGLDDMQARAAEQGGFLGFRLVPGEGTRDDPVVESAVVTMRWDQDPANPGSRILFMTIDEDVFLLPGRYVEEALSAWEH